MFAPQAVDPGVNGETHIDFIEVLKGAGFTSSEVNFIDAAYDLAKRAHSEAHREGGERYFEHCRAVALILIQEVGVRDPNTIAAALLHDTVEDTSIFGSYALHGFEGVREIARERLTNFFNEPVADYVLAVTKRHKTGDTELDRQNKERYFEELLTAPLGAILVKMADRLHNLRSVEVRPIEKQREQFEETQQVLLPIFESAESRSQNESLSRLLTLVRTENEMLGLRLSA